MEKKPYGYNGYIDFSKLWALMEKKKVNKQWLRNNGLHSNTVAKLSKNENVTCEVIAHLCKLLKCQPSQIMEYREMDERANTRVDEKKGIEKPLEEMTLEEVEAYVFS